MVYHPKLKSKTRRDLASVFANILSESVVPVFVAKTMLAWLRKIERKWKTLDTCPAEAHIEAWEKLRKWDTCPGVVDLNHMNRLWEGVTSRNGVGRKGC